MAGCLQYRSEAAKTFVTQGTWDVIKLVGYDEQKKLVYVNFCFNRSEILDLYAKEFCFRKNILWL